MWWALLPDEADVLELGTDTRTWTAPPVDDASAEAPRRGGALMQFTN